MESSKESHSSDSWREFHLGNLDSQCCRPAYILKQLDLDRKENATCDITIIVQKERYNAHKNVLGTYSKYFKTMFSGNFIEKENGFVTLRTVTKADFVWLLNYMYGEQLDLQRKTVSEIERAIDLSDMLCIDLFRNECKQQVLNWKKFTERFLPYETACKLGMKETTLEILEDLLKHSFFPTFRPFLSNLVRNQSISPRMLEDYLSVLRHPNETQQKIIDESGLSTMEILTTGPSLVLKFVSWSSLSEEESVYLLEKTMIRDLPIHEVGNCLLKANEFSHTPKDWPQKITTDEAKKNLKNALHAVNVVHSKIEQEIHSLNLSLSITTTRGMTIKSVVYVGDNLQRHTLFVSSPVKHLFQVGKCIFLASVKEIYKYNMVNKHVTLQNIPEVFMNKLDYQSMFVSNEDILYFLGKNQETGKVVLSVFNHRSEVFKTRELDLELQGKIFLTVHDDLIYFVSERACYKYDMSTCILQTIVVLNEDVFFDNVPFIDQPIVVEGNNLYIFPKHHNCLVVALRPLKENQRQVTIKCISKYVDAVPIAACISENRIVVALTSFNFENELQISVLDPISGEFRSVGFWPFIHPGFDAQNSRSQLVSVDCI